MAAWSGSAHGSARVGPSFAPHDPRVRPRPGRSSTGAFTEQMVIRFKENAGAWAFYQEQPPGYRRQTTRWVMSAKRDETRQRRLATLIDDSANGLRIKQFRKG